MLKGQRKILIIGGPRCGKTTLGRKLSRELGIPIDHFDNYINKYEWSEMSEKISDWLSEPGPWIKEGVAGTRGLRKWLRKNAREPDFEILILNSPHVKLTPGQDRMHKNHSKILQECLDELAKRKKEARA